MDVNDWGCGWVRPPLMNSGSESIPFNADGKGYPGLNRAIQNNQSQMNEHFLHGHGPSVAFNPQQQHQNLMIPISMMDRRRSSSSSSPIYEGADVKVKIKAETAFETGENYSTESESESEQEMVGKTKMNPKNEKFSPAPPKKIISHRIDPLMSSAVSRLSTPPSDKRGERRPCSVMSMKDFESMKPYACDQCHKRFSQKGGLNQHQRRHNGTRPFSCSHCEKRFTQKSGLVQHERLHTGTKPYQCQECSKKFTQKSGLDQHLRIHTGEKPYKCLVCSKCFTQLSGLKQHGKVHSKANSVEPESNSLSPLHYSQ